MSITIANLTKRFGRRLALDAVDLEVREGELLALLGPSGSGKTTLLRIIAGLEAPDQGSVHYHAEDVTHHSPRERNIGFVFQHYALFRHLSVFENVAFGLRVRKVSDARVRERVGELLHLVRLDGFERRLPAELSGGQRQRIALARALAAAPRVLLLDEPFGALDANVRQELRQWLRRLHDELHVTSILVTHDQEEAFAVADRVAVLRQGRIEQVGTPQEVFDHPASAFVMDFLGAVNVFPGRLKAKRAWLGNLVMDYPDYPHEEPLPVSVYVRPHELDLEPALDGTSAAPGRVLHITAAGSVARIQVRDESLGAVLEVELSRQRAAELNLRPGDRVRVLPRRIRVFEPDYVI
jgi:sulfate transport system ATP-binding protein